MPLIVLMRVRRRACQRHHRSGGGCNRGNVAFDYQSRRPILGTPLRSSSHRLFRLPGTPAADPVPSRGSGTVATVGIDSHYRPRAPASRSGPSTPSCPPVSVLLRVPSLFTASGCSRMSGLPFRSSPACSGDLNHSQCALVGWIAWGQPTISGSFFF